VRLRALLRPAEPETLLAYPVGRGARLDPVDEISSDLTQVDG
jgi:hypothetical protein